MSSIICGSLAFDNIMNFGGQFADQILPDQLHNLNVAFFVPNLRREWGGCAGNIAYALKILGGEPIVMAALGNDGLGYLQHLQKLDIKTDCILTVPEHHTAQAMIVTDSKNNQITAFHPGAMVQAHCNTITLSLCEQHHVRFGIVSPDGKDAMQQHAEQFHKAQIPFIFDPGQGLPMFDGTQLLAFIQLATWVTVNEYEASMLTERTGLDLQTLSSQPHLAAVVVTLGDKGCEVWENGQKTHVPPVQATAVVDPTGCGDAFRGAFLFGLEQGWNVVRCAQLGNALGALKIAQQGGQNYNVLGLDLSFFDASIVKNSRIIEST